MKPDIKSNMQHDRPKTLPVSILTGFLGSGKTTLLNRLLRSPQMAGTLVIVNEFGEVGLDHLFFETPQDETILLNIGCLCHSALGDLVVTLDRLIERRDAREIAPFDRIMIETTGLADPTPILRTIISDPKISQRLELNRVVTVVDTVHGTEQIDTSFEAIKQVTSADRLVISKVDLASDEKVLALKQRLKTSNPAADIIEAISGDVNADLICGTSPNDKNWVQWLDQGEPEIEPEHHAHHAHHGGHHHHGDEGIRTFSLYCDDPVTPDGLRLWLNTLTRYRGKKLLRLKAIMNVEGAPIVVQAVQNIFHEPTALDAWPDEDRRSRIVFITQGLERAELEPTLAALHYAPVQPGENGLPFGFSDYRRFVNAIGGFGAVGQT